MQEQARWLDSLEAKTQQLEAAFQSLSNTVLGSDVLKVLADGGIGVINTLDSIIVSWDCWELCRWVQALYWALMD